jgi:hypothetical protein
MTAIGSPADVITSTRMKSGNDPRLRDSSKPIGSNNDSGRNSPAHPQPLSTSTPNPLASAALLNTLSALTAAPGTSGLNIASLLPLLQQQQPQGQQQHQQQQPLDAITQLTLLSTLTSLGANTATATTTTANSTTPGSFVTLGAPLASSTTNGSDKVGSNTTLNDFDYGDDDDMPKKPVSMAPPLLTGIT